MNDEFQLTPLSPDADTAELLEALGPLEERAPESQYCVFRSGRERFCLPVLDVEEVLEWPNTTKLPLAPAYFIGVFNLRGSIVPTKRKKPAGGRGRLSDSRPAASSDGASGR